MKQLIIENSSNTTGFSAKSTCQAHADISEKEKPLLNSTPIKRYTTEFKLDVLTKLRDGIIPSIEEARRLYAIGGKMSVNRWAKQLGFSDLIPEQKIITEKKMNRHELLELNQRLLILIGRCYARITELEDAAKPLIVETAPEASNG